MADKLITVYKRDGKPIKVNSDMLKHIGALGWTKSKPKQKAD